ncbi:unnamed protein product [Pylaiella littoralis]
MEFHDLGKHCSVENCGQQDFLPFRCNACTNVFCLDHRSHAEHSCTNANFKDKRVLECPTCDKVLRRPPGVDHSILLQRHLASGCVDGVRKARPNKIGCSAQGCRGSEFVKVSCGTCRKNFCFKHRHEQDHKCQEAIGASKREHPHVQKRGLGRAGGSRPTGTPAIKPSGQAAVDVAGNSRPCGTESGKAAARRERDARTGQEPGIGSGITAR